MRYILHMMKKLFSMFLFAYSSVGVCLEQCSPEPIVLRWVYPEYPMPSGTTADLHTCHEGSVTIEFIITKIGKVIDPQVVSSTLKKGCRNRSAKEDFFYDVSINAILKYRYIAVDQKCSWRETITFRFEN